MTELLINKSLINMQKGYKTNPSDNAVKNPDNSKTDLDSKNYAFDIINRSNINKDLFSPFLAQMNNPYISNLIDKNNQRKVLTIAGGVTVLLGGASLLLGRNKLANLRNNLNQSVKFIQNFKDNNQFELLNKAKVVFIKITNNILGYMYSFDKVKDFSAMKLFESLGKPGKLVINASRSSLKITEKTMLVGLYKSFHLNANYVAKTVEKSLKSQSNFANQEEKILAQRLNVFMNGNNQSKGFVGFSQELLTGLKNRTDKMKKIISQKDIKEYREKYYPKSFNFNELKRTGQNWKKLLFSVDGNKDMLRENWAQTEEILLNNINNIGPKERNFGQARKELQSISEEMTKLADSSDSSKTFKNLAKQITDLNQRINNPGNSINPINFETSGEKYAGRVLDLYAGGGMTEILIPPIAGGLIAYHTFKNSKPSERKERFLKSGGPEFIGGLTGWMITANLLAISGPAGLLVGLASAGVMNILSNKYLNHLEKEKTKNT